MTAKPASNRRQPKQERSLKTVEAALAAASAVLERAGFDGFSMQAVADEAGLAIGTLYQYFPDKYKLLKALLQRWYEKSEKNYESSKSAAHDIDALAKIYFSEVGGPALLEAIQVVPELREYDRMKLEALVTDAAGRLSKGRTPTKAQLAEARVGVFAIDAVLREASRMPSDEAQRMIFALKRWLSLLNSDAWR